MSSGTPVASVRQNTPFGVANYDMLCWYCYAADLRPSLPRWYDIFVYHLFRGRTPFRCRNCRGRLWLHYTDPTHSSGH